MLNILPRSLAQVGILLACVSHPLSAQLPSGAPSWLSQTDDCTTRLQYEFPSDAWDPVREPGSTTGGADWLESSPPGDFTWQSSFAGRSGVWVHQPTGETSFDVRIQVANKAAKILRKKVWISYDWYSADPNQDRFDVARIEMPGGSRKVVKLFQEGAATPGWRTQRVQTTLDPCPASETFVFRVQTSGDGGSVALDNLWIGTQCEEGLDFDIRYSGNPDSSMKEMVRCAAQRWSRHLCSRDGTPQCIVLNIDFVDSIANQLAGQTTSVTAVGSQADKKITSARIKLLKNLHWGKGKIPKGKIDGLTVVLHEMGHALGMYHGLDHYVQSPGGLKSTGQESWVGTNERSACPIDPMDSFREHVDPEHEPRALMKKTIRPNDGKPDPNGDIRRDITQTDVEALVSIMGYKKKAVERQNARGQGGRSQEAAGAPRIAMERSPALGGAGFLRADDFSAGALFQLLVGTDNRADGLLPVPLSAGIPGLYFYVPANPAASAAIPADGSLRLPLIDFPNSPVLLGAPLYLQGSAVAPGGSIELSQAIEALLEPLVFEWWEDFPVDQTVQVPWAPVALPGGWTGSRTVRGSTVWPGRVGIEDGRLVLESGRGLPARRESSGADGEEAQVFGSEVMQARIALPAMPYEWTLRARLRIEGSARAGTLFWIRDLAPWTQSPLRAFVSRTGGAQVNGGEGSGPELADGDYWLELEQDPVSTSLRMWSVHEGRPAAALAEGLNRGPIGELALEVLGLTGHRIEVEFVELMR